MLINWRLKKYHKNEWMMMIITILNDDFVFKKVAKSEI